MDDNLKHKGGSALLDVAFKYYSGTVGKLYFQIPTVIVTLVLAGFSLYGSVLLRQEFDPIWFLPKDSYLFQWNERNEK